MVKLTISVLMTVIEVELIHILNTTEILNSALSVVISYSFFVFLIYAILDLLRWSVQDDIDEIHKLYCIQEDIRTKLSEVRQYTIDLKPNTIRIEELERDFAQVVSDMQKSQSKVKGVFDSLGRLIKWQQIRVYVIEIALPFGLGIFSFSKVSGSFLLFIKTAF
jgi:hypothetical protein